MRGLPFLLFVRFRFVTVGIIFVVVVFFVFFVKLLSTILSSRSAVELIDYFFFKIFLFVSFQAFGFGGESEVVFGDEMVAVRNSFEKLLYISTHTCRLNPNRYCSPGITHTHSPPPKTHSYAETMRAQISYTIS